jgi:hypothetical protein
MTATMFAALLSVMCVGLSFLCFRLLTAKRGLDRRFKGIPDLDAEVSRLTAQIETARATASKLQGEVAKLEAEHQSLEEEAVLRLFGFYKPIYDFASSEKYEQKLDAIRDRQKQMLKDKTAAVCDVEWQVNGSKVEGRKQITQTLKLMLRAFNGECDASVAKVSYKNVSAMEARITKAAQTINDLTEIQSCIIAKEYINLRLDELHLAHEYQEKLQSEREEQKRLREQMREEEATRKEFERAKLEVEREERRCEEALQKAREEITHTTGIQQQKMQAKIAELEARLSAAQEKDKAISQAQLTKTGHVYVISNIGSFGECVFKVGMTRRLVPMDRIDELGDASVPFEFDVHAMISTKDAPALEAAIHQALDHRRVNRINDRKEFFRVTLQEIESIVRTHHGEFELTRIAEAAEYRRTMALLDNEKQSDRPTTEAARKAA